MPDERCTDQEVLRYRYMLLNELLKCDVAHTGPDGKQEPCGHWRNLVALIRDEVDGTTTRAARIGESHA